MRAAVAMRIAETRQGRPVGAILVDAGQLRPEDIERVLAHQRERNLRFGEAALQLGLISEPDIQFALSRQFDYAYLRPATDRPRSPSTELVAAYQPFGAQAEQVRAIRSQLVLRWFNRGEGRQVLCIVGADRHDGRSYLAANLAVVFSQLGERTLLIDADLRTPRQHRLFDLDNRMGFSTLLAGRSHEEVVVRIPELPNLSVLPSGPTPPNPLELLNRLNLDECLIHARSAYDVVLIDSSAICLGEDAAMLAVRSGAALAVARCGSTRLEGLGDLVRGLGDAGVRVVGTVMNEVPVGARR